MEFDEVFSYTGGFGLYQVIVFFLMGSISFFQGMQSIAMNFIGGSMEHWCQVERIQNFTHDQQKYIAIPYEDDSTTDYESCEYFDLNYEDYTNAELLAWNRNSTGNASVITCDAWVYDKSIYVTTITSTLDLVCDQSWLVSMASTIYLGGVLVGVVTSGAASDRFGRYKTLNVCTIMYIITTIVATFMPDYVSFVIMRFLASLFGSASYLCGFVIVMEIVGPSFRVGCGVMFQMFFSAGFMVLSGIAAATRDYQKLQLALAIPSVTLVCFLWMVPESPRWLLTQGRKEDAISILRHIALVNNRTLPDNLDLQAPKEEEKGTFGDLFKSKLLRMELLIVWLAWFTASLVYYGLSLNTGALVGDPFLNNFISGCVEVPANLLCWFGLVYIGRRWTNGLAFIVAGVSSFVCIPLLFEDDLYWLLTTFTMIGKAAITVSFDGIYVHTAELFPTPVRNLALGSSSMMARVSGMAAPFFGPELMNLWLPLPSLVFGILSSVAGLLTFLLAETLGKQLPDSMEDAENLKRKNVVKGEKDVDGKVNVGFEEESDESGIQDSVQNSLDNFATKM